MKLNFTLSILFLFCGFVVKSQNISFPDPNFKAALIAKGVDTGGDREISRSEAEAVRLLDVSVRGISDLTGIQHFTNLQFLYCFDNSLSSLDVSGLTKLIFLFCYENSLDTLNVSGLTKLEYLFCYENSLETLNVSGLTKLEYFGCWDNSLTSLDVSGLTSLKSIGCSINPLMSLDVSGLTSLEFLYCSSTSLTTLDLSGLPGLEELYCNNNSLTSLDVSGLTSLKELKCSGNFFTSLDVSGLTNLQKLYCENSSLKSIDIRNTSSLNLLSADNNPDLECIIVDDVMRVPDVVITDQSPVPYSTVPCLISDFDDLEEVMEAGGIPRYTALVFRTAFQLAEGSCSQGSPKAATYQLYMLQLMVHRSRQIGRISASRAGELSRSIDKLIAHIRSGALDCSGGGKENLLDQIYDWFGYSLEKPGANILVASPMSESQTAQNIYPNPTADLLHFSQPDQKVVVYNMLGKVMGKASGVSHIDMSAFQPGVYAVQLGEGTDTRVFQVVKE